MCTDLLNLARWKGLTIVLTNQMKNKYVDAHTRPLKEAVFTEPLFQSVTNWIMLWNLNDKDIDTIDYKQFEKFRSSVIKI